MRGQGRKDLVVTYHGRPYVLQYHFNHAVGGGREEAVPDDWPQAAVEWMDTSDPARTFPVKVWCVCVWGMVVVIARGDAVGLRGVVGDVV